jgi:hypothetical protein
MIRVSWCRAFRACSFFAADARGGEWMPLPRFLFMLAQAGVYADYLGLDGQLFVDEYNARFNANGPPPASQQLELQTVAAAALRRYRRQAALEERRQSAATRPAVNSEAWWL